MKFTTEFASFISKSQCAFEEADKLTCTSANFNALCLTSRSNIWIKLIHDDGLIKIRGIVMSSDL
jgi:hypothetical protein